MFGILIGDIRKQSGLRIEKLANGLCTAGMLRKYETGLQEPEKLMADALFQRMGKSVDKYDIMLDADEYALAIERASLCALLTENSLSQAEQKIHSYTTLTGADKPLHIQFAALCKAELLRKQEAPLKQQEQNILYGLSQTIEEAKGTKLKPSVLQECRFCLNELYLLQRYAVLLEQKGMKSEAYNWHHGILEYLKPKKRRTKWIEYDNNDVRKLYPFSAYRLAVLHTNRHQYEEALELIEYSCRMLAVSNSQSALFAHMMEQKFYIQEKMGEQPEKWEQNCYELICETIGENRSTWRENWYPMPIELHLHSVNDVIHERRLAHGLSVETLALGICDSRTVRRVETGQSMPHKKSRDSLLKRLGLSTEKYDGRIVPKRYSDHKKMAAIIRCYNSGDIAGLEAAFQELKESINTNYITNHQAVEYWRMFLLIIKNKLTNEEYFAKLRDLFTETLPDSNNVMQAECELMKYERELFKTLAWWSVDDPKEDLVTILAGQYTLLNEKVYKRIFFGGFYNEIVYCYGRTLLTEEKYNDAENLFDKYLKNIWRQYDNIQLGQLLFARALVEQKKAKTKESDYDARFLHFLRCSYAVSKLYFRNKEMQDFLNRFAKENSLNNIFDDL